MRGFAQGAVGWHHSETMGKHLLVVFTGEYQFRHLSGGAGFRENVRPPLGIVPSIV